MKQSGMLVVSLRGINFGFWSRLRRSVQSANIYVAKVSFRVQRVTRGWVFFHNHVFTSLKLIACRICVLLSGLF